MDMQNVAKLELPEGEVRTIHDKDGNLIWGKVNYGVKYKGDTAQDGTPTPSAPVAVQTATGENVVKISDGQNERSYEVNLGKNLFDKDLPLSKTYYTSTGATATYTKDQFINFVLTPTSRSLIMSFSARHDKQQGSSITANVRILQYDSSGTFISRLMSWDNNHLFSLDSNTTKILVCIDAGEDAYFDNLQLEYGTQATSYSAYFTPIELCKIGIYQDYIYKSGDKWYVHKEVGKNIYNGTENWGYESQTYYLDGFNGKPYSPFDQNAPLAVSPHFKWGGGSAGTFNFGDFWYTLAGTRLRLEKDENPDSTTLASFKTWLASNPLAIYYALATPTDTEITNEALVAQLEVVEQWLTRYGYNAIVTGNLPIIIDRTAL